MKKYGAVKILMAHMHIAWQTPKKQPPLAHTTTLEVCPFRDLSLGNRDPYVGILVPTRNPLPEGTLGKLVLHRNR